MPVACDSCGSSNLDLIEDRGDAGRLLGCDDCGAQWVRGGSDTEAEPIRPEGVRAAEPTPFEPIAHPGADGRNRFVWLAESNKALAYHSAKNCSALIAAQKRVSDDGGTNSRVIQRRLRDAEEIDRTPCETCWT